MHLEISRDRLIRQEIVPVANRLNSDERHIQQE
jgi:hypothetical protein